MVEKPDLPTDSILIKRYAKRRLYNTTSFTYVSLGDLADMVLRQQRFVVRDAETDDDITGEILDRLH